MRKERNIERKIRLNAIFIYVIVALSCIGLFMYLYSQREMIGAQKRNIEKNKQALELTNTLISFVNEAQANANLYIMSKEPNYIILFRDNMEKIPIYIDSLKPYSSQKDQESILDSIEPLLKRKVQTISELNIQFDSYSFTDSLNKKMRMREFALLDDGVKYNTQKTIIISNNEKDTLQKGFFKRLAQAFSPTKATSKASKEVVIIDSSQISHKGTIEKESPTLSELLLMTHSAIRKYTKQIGGIEKQVATLMMSDHEISVQLSRLLIDLHQQTIYSTMNEIQKSEKLIRRNYINSIIGSAISLALILASIIFIIRNVSKSRQMRIAVERANIRIQQTFESRHKLLLSISHDVKTPINSILGYLELSEQGHVITSKEISAMRYSGNFILSMVENLLEFSHLDQGLKYKSYAEFNLYNLCCEVQDLVTPFIMQKELVLDAQFNFDKTLNLYSDELKIRRIIINILSNAVKYTVKGGVQFYVSYSNGQILFNLNDTGKGIPPERIGTIFDAFKRVEENNSLATGNGFGLFVAKGLVNLLEGTITVRSKVNEGTQIEVVIPAKEAIEKVEKRKYKQILAIDDDVIFSTMLQKMLINLGHGVDICHSIETCKNFMTRISDYDVILTDADMITFSGEDILRKMEKNGIKLPIILMSGQYYLNDSEAKRMGFDGFLQKPVTMASLQNLFGGNEKTSNVLPTLEELFGGDKKVISKILKAFVADTNRHIALLGEAVKDNDFLKARQVCHKMSPMFIQMKVDNAVVILAKINGLQNELPDEQLLWKEDILNLIDISKNLLVELRHKI